MSKPGQPDSAMPRRHRATRGYESPKLTTLTPRVRLYHQTPGREWGGEQALGVVLSAVALALFGLGLPLVALAIALDARRRILVSRVRLGIHRRSRERIPASGDPGPRAGYVRTPAPSI